ncbi:hypothetical protein E2C01_086479 [Portunus trituberculatus]|uniref:Uncharacterized protein n=1 Tax=Portunus trituberculatus TaxID=210409 RepID=A0A5B7J0X4_PORTR|nr:hypothetical protein [Portunus trituberculatus]
MLPHPFLVMIIPMNPEPHIVAGLSFVPTHFKLFGDSCFLRYGDLTVSLIVIRQRRVTQNQWNHSVCHVWYHEPQSRRGPSFVSRGSRLTTAFTVFLYGHSNEVFSSICIQRWHVRFMMVSMGDNVRRLVILTVNEFVE